jgi:hypothetical protein
MARSISELTDIAWPEGKSFAFTIFDDTDGSTVENTAPLYDVLKDLGFRTTKSAWPLATPGAPRWRGATCAEPDYLAWIKHLQADGFEIGYHHVSCLSSERQRTIEGIARFKELFGPPVVGSNHYDNLESVYWGSARLSGLARWIYRFMTLFRSLRYQGHKEGSPYFWGDVCRRELPFFRNFVYADINTLKKCPYMPYYDKSRPFVRAWYASADGGNGDRFCNLIAPENQERLEKERGACIVYTHLARNFMRDGKVRDDFLERMTMLSKRNGWFVPVGRLIEHIRDQHGGVYEVSKRERRGLEWSWLWDKAFLGST